MDVMYMGFSYKVLNGANPVDRLSIQNLNNFIHVNFYLSLALPMILLLPQADRKTP